MRGDRHRDRRRRARQNVRRRGRHHGLRRADFHDHAPDFHPPHAQRHPHVALNRTGFAALVIKLERHRLRQLHLLRPQSLIRRKLLHRHLRAQRAGEEKRAEERGERGFDLHAEFGRFRVELRQRQAQSTPPARAAERRCARSGFFAPQQGRLVDAAPDAPLAPTNP